MGVPVPQHEDAGGADVRAVPRQAPDPHRRPDLPRGRGDARAAERARGGRRGADDLPAPGPARHTLPGQC